MIIEAETETEANDKAAVMEDEDIDCDRFENSGYTIWNEASKVK